MKKLFTLLLFIVGANLTAQIVITPNPFDINSGVITMTYSPSTTVNGTLYLFTGADTNGVASTMELSDNFGASTSLISFIYNSNNNNYTASFNISTHVYINGVVINGTRVYNWYFMIKDSNGSLTGSLPLDGKDYGFGEATLKTSNFDFSKNEIQISSNKITSFMDGITKIEVYNLLGQKANSYTLTKNQEVDFNTSQKGVYVAVISNGEKKGSIKFLN